MKRRVFNVLSAVSLLMAVAVVAQWARSVWTCESFVWSQQHWYMRLMTSDGEVLLEFARRVNQSWFTVETGFSYQADKADGGGVMPDRIPGERLHFKAHGFACVTGERWGEDHYVLTLPGWFLLGIVLIPAAACLRTSVARRRRKLGVCRACGYDLRASKDKCPECGAAIATAGKVNAP